ncbi:hypothetical protein AAII07_54765, partial [Microvirga sp. 0TCS3.31]
AETAPTQRDRHLQMIQERGRLGWQKGICCKFDCYLSIVIKLQTFMTAKINDLRCLPQRQNGTRNDCTRSLQQIPLEGVVT